MTVTIKPGHVAVLVPSARRAADHLRQFGFQIGKEEAWEDVGTREIYVERDKANSLLIMEPAKPGVYQRAMEKRGPGIHHLAIDVPDLEDYIQSIESSGWLLHPSSIRTMKSTRAVYLARPGFPALIEVQEQSGEDNSPVFVETVMLQMDDSLARLIEYAGLADIVRPSQKETELSLAGRIVRLQDLL